MAKDLSDSIIDLCSCYFGSTKPLAGRIKPGVEHIDISGTKLLMGWIDCHIIVAGFHESGFRVTRARQSNPKLSHVKGIFLRITNKPMVHQPRFSLLVDNVANIYGTSGAKRSY